MLRNILSKSSRSLTGLRASSSAVLTELHPANDELAVIKMNAPPINALSRPFLSDLQAAIKKVETDEEFEDCRGFILTSNKPGIFSAGLDITEMWKNKPGRNKDDFENSVVLFWTQLQDTWRTLYSTPLLTVAAINGTAPAGGCLLSISCDHRVMADHPKFQIGLNETKLGLVAPKWFATPFTKLVGPRKSEKYLYQGTLLPVQQALADGLIDDAVSPDQVDAIAVQRAEEYLSVPDFARAGTKQVITRGDDLAWFDKNRKMDLDTFVGVVMNPKTQGALDMYMAMLQNKSKKK